MSTFPSPGHGPVRTAAASGIVAAVEVYFWDETRVQRHCRVPASWRLLYKHGEEWKLVEATSPYATEPNAFNRVTFTPVETPALRIEAQLKPEWSGGMLEWRVEEARP